MNGTARLQAERTAGRVGQGLVIVLHNLLVNAVVADVAYIQKGAAGQLPLNGELIALHIGGRGSRGIVRSGRRQSGVIRQGKEVVHIAKLSWLEATERSCRQRGAHGLGRGFRSRRVLRYDVVDAVWGVLRQFIDHGGAEELLIADAVRSAHHSLGIDAIGQAEPGSEVQVVLVDESAIEDGTAASYNQAAGGTGGGIEVRELIVGLEGRRRQLVTQAQINRELVVYSPVVLAIKEVHPIVVFHHVVGAKLVLAARAEDEVGQVPGLGIAWVGAHCLG